MLVRILTLLGGLGMFLMGMTLMSSGIQKAAGSRLRRFLGSLTSSPFKGVLTGFGVTSIIQSSSATTVMVVSFVNAGLMTLAQAIGVIMGANIGTTATAWIVSIFGFKMDISTFAVPLMAVAFILSVIKQEKAKNIGEFIFGFALLFLGLVFMKDSVPSIQDSPQLQLIIAKISGHGFWSVLLFLTFGTVLTLILQSSSATVALTLIALDLGWIQFDMAAAMVLGENIGTTITANIAAIVANTEAKRAALTHTLFNVFGAIWALALFQPFVNFVQWIVSLMNVDAATSLVYGISTFHTTFNLVNTSIMIWFVKPLEKIVTFLVREKKPTKTFQEIQYLDYGLIRTPELAITEAGKETIHFAKIMKNGLEYLDAAIRNSDSPEKFMEYREKLVKYEEISDKIEYEIIKFLNDLGREGLSEESKANVRSLIRICRELESLGDSGESISRSIMHMQAYGRTLTPEHVAKLSRMTGMLSQAYEDMIWNLENAADIKDIKNAEIDEQAINEYRDECREEELKDIESKGDAYFETIFYLNTLNGLEKMGDFLINISQALI